MRLGAALRICGIAALGGLGCLAGSMTATLGLIVYVVLGGGWALAVGVVGGSAFLLLWFVLPLRLR